MTAGSGDGSLTHFFIDALDDPIAYPSESGELANAKPTPERRHLLAVMIQISYLCPHI